MSLVLCAGCGQQQANADEVSVSAPPPPFLIAAAADSPADAKQAETKPAEAPASPIAPLETPAAPKPIEVAPDAKGGATIPAKPNTNEVEAAVMPDSLQVTPALAEVIKLIQAGVGEDVLMTYITNSAEVFSISSNEILYLHDLGAPPTVITTLIQTDIVRKQAAGTAKPLPPGLALTTPATNIFAPKAGIQPVSTAQDQASAEPGVETVSTAPSALPATEGEPPVVYAPEVPQQPANISYFYTELAPYGSWVDVPGYGHCWRPTVAVWNSSWRPYGDGGRWLWSDHGWYWYSDYSWGWAPFHYGRWSCPAGVGWVWTPDTCWGPAWVSWRYSRNHCGWAPLPPAAHFVVGHGFYHNNLSVGVSFDFGLSDHHYVFVPTSRFCDRSPVQHRLTARHANTVFKESTVVNNYVSVNKSKVVNEGVGFDRVRSATRGNIRQVALKDTTEIRGTNTRRETLAPDGTTLTVARPAPSAPTVSPSVRNGSASSPNRPRTQRDSRATPGVVSSGSGLVSGTTSTERSARTAAITPPANSTIPSGNGTTAAAAATPSRFQRPGMVPTSRSAVRADAVTTTDSGAIQPPANNGSGRPGRSTVTLVSPPSPRGPVTVSTPTSAEPVVSDRQRPQSGRQVAAVPTPAPETSGPSRPATPSVSRPVASRPAPSQNYVQPVSPRAQSAPAPAPSQPRYNAPAPAVRSAPAPATVQSAPAPSRSESYRPSSAAPAPSYSPPARSSGDGSAPSAPSRPSSSGNSAGRPSR